MPESNLPAAQTAGLLVGGLPSGAEIKQRAAQLKEYLDGVREAVKSVMTEGPDGDYGTIPGTKKPTLLQPGADKLMGLFGLRVTYDTHETEGTDGRYDVRVAAKLWRGDVLMGESTARASSYESKWRYRFGSRVCPQCGKDTIRKSKYADEQTGQKGWYCHAKAGGCGAQFRENDPAIVEQEVGKIQNTDIVDVYNTVLQVAQKRAKVAVVRTALRLTDMFTQDVGDPETPRAEDEPDRPDSADAALAPNGKPGTVNYEELVSWLAENKITKAAATKWAHDTLKVNDLSKLTNTQARQLMDALKGE